MEKVGKMVLKIKPWKSGTNKLSSSRQFRAACKKLERLNLTFLRTKFIFRKGQGIYWKKFFARKGPLPLPNRFLRPTRVHLEAEQAPHPPDLCYWPFHPISQALSNSFFLNSINSVDGIESWCALSHENLTNTCPTIKKINFLISFL